MDPSLQASISVLAFFFFALIAAAIIQGLVSKLPVKSVPVSIPWFVFGMILEGLVLWSERQGHHGIITQGTTIVSNLPAQMIYLTILPILLFEATQNIHWHLFVRFLPGGLLLAVLGVMFQIALLGPLVHFAFDQVLPYGRESVPWAHSFLIASSLSSTDPVAVQSALRSIGAPSKLSIMFEGEALINDGSSILFFQFFLALGRGGAYTWQEMILKFVTLLLVGPIWGVLSAFVFYVAIGFFHRSHTMQSLALISGGYLCYFVAEVYLRASGPLSVVCYGLFFRAYANISMETEAQEKHRHLVEALGVAANSLTFIVSGIISMRMIFDGLTNEKSANAHGEGAVKVWHLPVLYVFLNLVRAGMLAAFSPLLRRIGYGVSWKELTLLVWGGLRGAMVLILGLVVEQDPLIEYLASFQATFYLSGSVLLILLVNGTTFELLYKFLNPYPTQPFRRIYLEKVTKMIDYNYMEQMQVLSGHWLCGRGSILQQADMLVPTFGWRKLNKLGQLPTSLPNVRRILTSQDIEDAVSSVSSSRPSSPSDRAQRAAAVCLHLREGSHVVPFDVETPLGLFSNENLIFPTAPAVATDDSITITSQADPVASPIRHQTSLPFLEGSSASFQLAKESTLGRRGFGSTLPKRAISTPVLPPITIVERSNSLKSDEELWEIPGTPTKRWHEHNRQCSPTLEGSIGGRRVKVFRKEREGELYLLVFNAVRQMYKTLYENHFLGGTAFLSLSTSLDAAEDFALGKAKNFSANQQLRGALIRYKGGVGNPMTELEISLGETKPDQLRNIQDISGFEAEWRFLAHRLNCLKPKSTMWKCPFRWVQSFKTSLTFTPCLLDLQRLAAFVDVHQELLHRGGPALEDLLGPDLLETLKTQLRQAVDVLETNLQGRFPSIFGLAMTCHTVAFLLNLKKQIIEEECVKGLLSDVDRDRLIGLLEEQHRRVRRFRPSFYFGLLGWW